MEWISVEERLPDEGNPVLAVDRNKRGSEVVASYFNKENPYWELCWDSWPVNVTHWMPLPEPPGEG